MKEKLLKTLDALLDKYIALATGPNGEEAAMGRIMMLSKAASQPNVTPTMILELAILTAIIGELAEAETPAVT